MEKERETEERSPEERGQWGSKVEFLLAVAGNIVGLGNVWRFPYLCYKNGGGAFLVPYVLFATTCGIPLFLLEIAMGQYTQEGGITCYRKLCPLAEGIGYAGQLIVFYGCMSYVTILAWALLYLYFSFSFQLPWSSCSNTWNSGHCVDFSNQNRTTNWTQLNNHTSSAATEFWERRVLLISGGIEEPGSVRWEVLLCSLIMWVICYFCIWKGVKSTGKVVYFTATFPPFGVDGGWLSDLLLVQFGSGLYDYARELQCANNNNCYKDTIWLCLLNSATSFVAGFAVFSVLGFMAHEQGVPIDEVAESGPGLAFIAYPQAVAMMPFPQLWSCCFFFMILLLGLDSQFVAIEGLITSVSDMFPMVLRKPRNRKIFILLFCSVTFFSSLGMVTEGGMYVFQLFDYYACNGTCVFFLCVFEVLAMGWLFGADRWMDVIEDMTGDRPNPFFKFCWLYITPAVTLGTFIYSCVEYQPLTFNRWYIYPDWAYTLGWLMALSSVVLVPGWSLVKLFTSNGTLRQRLSHLCHPGADLPMTRKQMAQRGLMIVSTEMADLMINKK
ncbi:hypothetical protein GJAV_G00002980 [Gymnothorax javanicus]|nr:hypothetical protein GJAV_G00002980 [Gymnothorax javanicus]